jgi:putative iron-regulated protein
MERKTRLWLSLGVAVLGGATAAAPPLLAAVPRGGADSGADAPRPAVVGLQYAQEDGGEGAEGEGGAVTIADYRLRSSDPNAYAYDAAAQVATYGALAYESYAAAHAEAVKLQGAIAALLASPTAETLAAARFAWLNARPAYMQTDVFRFYGGPIEGAERRINGWPLNESVIDYVDGNPGSGIVNSTALPLTLDTIVLMQQAFDVTTGWHAIEFLLWGQDLSATGPGARPHTDYVAGQGNNDRRRDYLRIVTDLLVNDLGNMVAVWAPGRDNYRSSLAALDQRNVIGRAFHGMAVLAGYELATKRIGVALDNRDGDDEQSRFSDNTLADHINNVRGIRNVYFGSARGADSAGFDALLAGRDPAINNRVIAALNRADHALAALDAPYDRTIASPPGSPPRAEAEEAVNALNNLADALVAAGNRLGVLVLMLPGE